MTDELTDAELAASERLRRQRMSDGVRRHYASPNGEEHRRALSGPQSEQTRRLKSEAGKRAWARRKARALTVADERRLLDGDEAAKARMNDATINPTPDGRTSV